MHALRQQLEARLRLYIPLHPPAEARLRLYIPSRGLPAPVHAPTPSPLGILLYQPHAVQACRSLFRPLPALNTSQQCMAMPPEGYPAFYLGGPLVTAAPHCPTQAPHPSLGRRGGGYVMSCRDATRTLATPTVTATPSP